jgi:glycosyltransferase involved in cell wall biosynthesis
MDGERAPDERAPQLLFVNRFYRPDISATSQMLTDLAEALASQGLRVTVICSRQLYESPAASLRPHEVLAGVRVVRVGGTTFGRQRLALRIFDFLSFYCTATWRLWRLCRRHDLVVAKTDPPLFSVCAALVTRVRGARLVNWLQDLFPEVASQLGTLAAPAWFHRTLRSLRDRSLRAAVCNVVLGERMRDRVLASGVAAERIRIIENWSDASGVSSLDPAQSTLRAQLGLGGKFVVGYSGNFGRAHDYHTLLHAMRVLSANPDIAFLMVGGGALMTKLRAAVAREGLQQVVFCGYQPREALADGLAAPDIHLVSLLPELEGLIVPSKFYGILAAGRPVIFVGDREGELARVVLRESVGAVVTSGYGDDLVAAIQMLRTDTALREECASRARALFASHYTLDRALGQWHELLAAAAVTGTAPAVTAGTMLP